MTAPVGFDTLAFVKRLSAAGMDLTLAEALTEALADNAFTQLATKGDVKELELATKANLTEMEIWLRAEMKDLKDQLTGRFGAMIAASTALTVAILGTLDALS